MNQELDKEELREQLLSLVSEKNKDRYAALIDKLLSGKVLSAIRAKCMDCTAYQEVEVRSCDIRSCPLWPFRMAKNPFRKRTPNQLTRANPFQKVEKEKEQ